MRQSGRSTPPEMQAHFLPSPTPALVLLNEHKTGVPQCRQLNMQKKQTTSSASHPPTQAGSKGCDSIPTAAEERLLTVGEVARILHYSRSMIYWLSQRGDLPSVRLDRLHRFRARDVRQFMERLSREQQTRMKNAK